MGGAVVGFKWSAVFGLWVYNLYADNALKACVIHTKINAPGLNFSCKREGIFESLA